MLHSVATGSAVGVLGLLALSGTAGASGWAEPCGYDSSGRVTCELADTDGDGVVDAQSYDLDGNGVIERLLIDLDRDGYFEAVGSDLDQDGIIDVVETDSDLDGYLESAVFAAHMGSGSMTPSPSVATDGFGPVLVPLANYDFDGDGIMDLVDTDAVDYSMR